ncbi:MAG: hypothetical protein EBY22_14535 [Gammaproteobacteria bacterium]|nr:hypothetical protein [Gammaproteobacteria bacterium]
MADAYGTITFTKSKGCVIDGPNLLDALNEFNWDSWGLKWQYRAEDKTLVLGQCQYPSVTPMIETKCNFINEAGEECVKDAADMTADDWEGLNYSEEEPIPISQLRDKFAPHIKSGWIEIAYSSNEKAREVNFGRLRIAHDGKAFRQVINSGPMAECVELFESTQ